MKLSTHSVTVSRVVSTPQVTAAPLFAGRLSQAPVNVQYRHRQLRGFPSTRGGLRVAQCACNRNETAVEACKHVTASYTTVGTSLLATLFLLTSAWPAESQAAVQHLHNPEAFQLATGDSDFWVNVSRYGRYFITVLLGTAYITVKPILQLLKRPKTAIAVVLGLLALYFFVSTTVQANIVVTNPLEYHPTGLLPDNYLIRM